ncbi:MAG: antitoxin [Desulfurococcales archaeon ex4484_217_1]|nr:MAG: antitoxin [Desulfurococcales archaeon ex4484_217_1]
MGNTVVIGVRVPKWVKKELEKLGIDYSREIREYLINRVREERAKRLIKEIDELAEKIGYIKGNLSSEFIREDRDWNWGK